MKKKIMVLGGALLIGGMASAVGQPATAPLTPNNACAANAGSASDTVVSTQDDSGYLSIFDGKDFKGWWESCQTAHSPEDRVNGGVWLVDTTYHAITSQQNPNGAGSVIMTNKKYTNYEVMIDYWSDFGDDGGIFNRTGPTGDCYQTTLDYIKGSSVGGSYAENGYPGSFNIDPYLFNSTTDPTVITNTTQWTAITAANNPTSYGCPSTGCTAADWTKVWDINGWMQIKFKFYSGVAASDSMHMQSWFRKYGTIPWVPVLDDSHATNTPTGYIGLQIHHTSARWGGAKGAWYRNILVRPLDTKGNPTDVPTPVAPGAANSDYKIFATANDLVGSLDLQHEITVTDIRGRVLDRFSGSAGSFQYHFTTSYRGLMLVRIKTARGEEYLRVSRIF